MLYLPCDRDYYCVVKLGAALITRANGPEALGPYNKHVADWAASGRWMNRRMEKILASGYGLLARFLSPHRLQARLQRLLPFPGERGLIAQNALQFDVPAFNSELAHALVR